MALRFSDKIYSTVASAAEGALFSSLTIESDCFWIGTTTFACFLGLSGVVGRALSMGLNAIERERERGMKKFDLKAGRSGILILNRESMLILPFKLPNWL